MKAKVYNREGKENGSVELPESVFGLPWNSDLVHQVVVSSRANARQNNAKVKDRGEVRGGGKKPWRQKGTGRARHGSTRSPLWRHGGVTHGPTAERDYAKKINRKMKQRALFTLISRKWRDGEVLLVEDLALAAPKTKAAHQALAGLKTVPGFEKLAYRKGKRALVALPAYDLPTLKSFRNLPTIRIETVANLNPAAVVDYQYLLFSRPEESLRALSARAK